MSEVILSDSRNPSVFSKERKIAYFVTFCQIAFGLLLHLFPKKNILIAIFFSSIDMMFEKIHVTL